MTVSLGLFLLCAGEGLFRAGVEVREARHGCRPGVFGILRCIPIVNDFVPAEGVRISISLEKNGFVVAHERAHEIRHHHLLRVLVRIAVMLLAVFAAVFALGVWHLTVWQTLIVLHLLLAVLRVPFHFFCWFQEYEADALALEGVSGNLARRSLETLRLRECPRSSLFALLYQEHPPAWRRLEHLHAAPATTASSRQKKARSART